MPPEQITQKDIAEALGLSKQAVSLALRGSLKVSEATREKVNAKAKALGYQPDPSLSALVKLRTGSGKVPTRWNQVALVHNWPTESGLQESWFYREWLKNLQDAASARGIAVKEYWLGAGGEHTASVLRKLRACGITGLFIAPPPQIQAPKKIEIPTKQFQVVTFGPEHMYSELHTIQFDYYENLRLAWATLSQRGHQRIGLVSATYQSLRTGHAWRAAYHIEKLQSGCEPGQRMPLELDSETGQTSCNAYLKWVQANDCDAVISSVYDVEDWNRKLKSPPEVAIFNVRKPEQQGIDINMEQMAETAIELLLFEMQRSQLAHTKHPYRIHIPGKWVERE
ncbi:MULTISPECIES: LacI family DNA-binding transcriptional regulator [unclassified Lentimonas]|uniref:LacI family DNA-binding transcriptional regulator n=1 Tax=unclassified Lentimonas TaxID=2630993 RepID=UPI001323044C|nr:MULTISPECIES: LacI family DNA-binding transcriptional regulator [unclassified Lentimonas]CAA6692481.1 Unannotated [Lentimonas sp. CC19]CAA6693442.1 Unannotated [Lentimonas sp. CC10]CAA7070771.1 Unannotated [Lentimonas sp. CC11]